MTVSLGQGQGLYGGPHHKSANPVTGYLQNCMLAKSDARPEASVFQLAENQAKNNKDLGSTFLQVKLRFPVSCSRTA